MNRLDRNFVPSHLVHIWVLQNKSRKKRCIRAERSMEVNMSVTIILGTQWGDEGKGKAIDTFAGDFDYVARFNGGNNAGHTIVNEYGTFKIHLVPSGIFYPKVKCLIGGGVVIDPGVLIDEMNALRQAGIKLEDRLLISPRSHVIMPYH